MTPAIKFEHHLSERVLEIHFEDGLKIKSREDIEGLRTAWAEALKKWHSPYTCLFDCRNLELEKSLIEDFEGLIRFFKSFFMKKIIGFVGETEELPEPPLPFEVFQGYESAAQKTGLARGAGLTRDLTDLRSRIQIDNDFVAHVMEVSFLAETTLDTKEDLETLRSKLQNILMMWHTPYSVVFDCSHCSFTETGLDEFKSVERFLKGFFCKEIVGYSPKAAKEKFPFPCYRSRHKAVGQLTHEGLASGSEANCSSRRTARLEGK